MVATYRSSDDDPKERFVHQQAGDGGYGGSSYIDLVAFREKDANTDWDEESDGVLEQRIYYCQNQHADVVSLITSAGGMREMDRYSAYGVPFGLPVGDANSDGKSNSADRTQIQNWINASNHYDVRGDLDLDGDVDLDDKDTLQYTYGVVDLGRGILSASAVGNRRGVAGYGIDPKLAGSKYGVRNRVYEGRLGVWIGRDPVGSTIEFDPYGYVSDRPITFVDPSGEIKAPIDDPRPTIFSVAEEEDPCCKRMRGDLGLGSTKYWGYTACCNGQVVHCAWNIYGSGRSGKKFAGEIVKECTKKHEKEHGSCCQCSDTASDGKAHNCKHKGQSSAQMAACCAAADAASAQCLKGKEKDCDTQFPPDSPDKKVQRANKECREVITETQEGHPTHGEGGKNCE